MAVLTYFQSVDLIAGGIALDGGEIALATPNRIQVLGNGFEENYYGSFFYSGLELAGGTVTGADVWLGGRKAFAISDGNLPALALLSFVEAGDLQGLTGYIFASADTVHGSAESDVLAGFGGNDQLFGNAGSDLIMGGVGNDALDGGAGIDTVVYATSSGGQILTKTATGWQVDASRDDEGIDQLRDIEVVRFADRSVDLQTLERAGSVSVEDLGRILELYVAYFDRAPDTAGLCYWANALHDGMSLQGIAHSFFEQAESGAAYPPDQPVGDLVRAVYSNVLDRVPDTEGLAYWVDELDRGAIHRADFVLAVINAAHGASGSADDALLLDNKKMVGMRFSVEKGLYDLQAAEQVMALVDSTGASVSAANLAVDTAYQQALAEGGELLIQLLGVSDFIS